MRVTVIVIDSFGIGALPDAEKFGDEGANTALHICEQIPGPKWPALRKMGLGNCAKLLGFNLSGCEAVENPSADYGVMAERSPGKDTTTGHWEIAGIVLDKPFRIFPQDYPSFPEELVIAFEQKTGCKMLGNKAASGTVIIEELGNEHIETGYPICYTSADSVFQIAAHEGVIPVDELYRICEAARKLCDRYNVARVIARPFVGKPGGFKRTGARKDFSIALPEKCLMDHLSASGIKTIGVGKIGSLFNEQGLTESYHDSGNPACLERTISLMSSPSSEPEFLFVNLVDTDMLYGHRRDVGGYFQAVNEIDTALSEMIGLVKKGDLLVITADHGCDPAYRGTDHTREYVPLLVYRGGRCMESGGEATDVKKGSDPESTGAMRNLGIRESFADVAQSICSWFSLSPIKEGVSFL
ncbi:MAG: phosphopentomutase [Spirochaetes bacterium]|nr:MAG: phosphopentomutase [Spirochaetota bacterium]